MIYEKGQHAILFGDRGVGKTSLANIISKIVVLSDLTNTTIAVRVNCDAIDDFASIWRKVFNEIQLVQSVPSVGFRAQSGSSSYTASSLFPGETISPDDVRRILATTLSGFLPVIIIDEFDRLKPSVRRPFADMIKSLSDHAISAAVILIGVGDSVEELIKEHESISRSLVQVHMPRMTPVETKEIIVNGLKKLGMTIKQEVLDEISTLSKGLPHYVHLIGKHAAREALDRQTLEISEEHFKSAVSKSIEDGQLSIKTAYHAAIRSTKTTNLFPDVLLACAITPVNELGEFAAQDIKPFIREITGKPYEISAFARHLDEFSSVDRGNILIKTGARKRYRYRFKDPLMQSYIMMKGLLSGRIKKLNKDI